METLANLESFVRSAELGSFSAAARRLSLTPAAVSRNVGMLERNLGVRLFQRSTRQLMLTEAGERFLPEITGSLEALQSAIATISSGIGEPAGVLKVSMSPNFGKNYILPLLPEFLARYPAIRPDWHMSNRQVDLVAEGFDVAIGGGFELAQGVISRAIAPAHIVAVASPAYLEGRVVPDGPADLAAHDGILMRSERTGRLRYWTMRDVGGVEMIAEPREKLVLNDPLAIAEAARRGLGVAFLAMPDALPLIEKGELVRLTPRWYADAGAISIYYSSRTLLPAKTRAFVDHVIDSFARQRLGQRFAGSIG